MKRKFRPRCCAKTRAGAPCIMRVVPGKRRCRFHGGLSTGPRTVCKAEPGLLKRSDGGGGRRAEVLTIRLKD